MLGLPESLVYGGASGELGRGWLGAQGTKQQKSAGSAGPGRAGSGQRRGVTGCDYPPLTCTAEGA